MMFIIALFLTSALEGPALFSWLIFPLLFRVASDLELEPETSL